MYSGLFITWKFYWNKLKLSMMSWSFFFSHSGCIVRRNSRRMLVFGAVAKVSLGLPISHIWVLGFQHSSAPDSVFLLLCRRWLTCFCSCQLCGRPVVEPRLLALALAVVNFWGRVPVGGRYFCFCSLSACLFAIRSLLVCLFSYLLIGRETQISSGKCRYSEDAPLAHRSVDSR